MGRWPTFKELGLGADAVRTQVSCTCDIRPVGAEDRQIVVWAHHRDLLMSLPILKQGWLASGFGSQIPFGIGRTEPSFG